MNRKTLWVLIAIAVIVAILLLVFGYGQWQKRPSLVAQFTRKPPAAEQVAAGADAQTGAKPSGKTAAGEADASPEKPSEKAGAKLEKGGGEAAGGTADRTGQQTEKASAARPEGEREEAGTTPTAQADRAGEATKAPSFDIVRVEEDGAAVIAGRAVPGSRVEVLLDGEVLGQVTANERGEWVFVPEKPFPTGAHELLIRAVPEKGEPVVSRQSVALTIPGRGQKPLIVLSEPSAPSRVLQRPETPQQVAAATPPESEKDMGGAEERPAPEAITREKTAETAESARPDAAARPDAGEVSRAAAGTQAGKGSATVALRLDVVDYDENGDIFFTGKAAPGTILRLYVDNQYVGDARAGQDGAWTFHGRHRVAAGVHRLRVDRIRADGRVIERIELPFMRMPREEVQAMRGKAGEGAQKPAAGTEKAPEKTKVAAAQGRAQGHLADRNAAPGRTAAGADTPPAGGGEETAAGRMEATQAAAAAGEMASPQDSRLRKGEAARLHVGKVVIQPGDNLWNIARAIYGRGIRYTVIYEANRDQIRDPDLIYPGQVFTTPRLGEVDSRETR